MADQTDVYIKNRLNDNIEVARNLPDGSIDIVITVTGGEGDRIFLPGPEVSLIIRPPRGVPSEDCSFNVSNEELLSWSAMEDHWTVEIKPNSIPPETPTIVEVTVGSNLS